MGVKKGKGAMDMTFKIGFAAEEMSGAAVADPTAV